MMQKEVGPTYDYPDGKIGPDDMGALNVGVGHHRGRLMLNFGTDLQWCGLGIDGAREFADLIEAHIAKIDPADNIGHATAWTKDRTQVSKGGGVGIELSLRDDHLIMEFSPAVAILALPVRQARIFLTTLKGRINALAAGKGA